MLAVLREQGGAASAPMGASAAATKGASSVSFSKGMGTIPLALLAAAKVPLLGRP